MSLSINKILYPTDYSPGSPVALTQALKLAKRFGAELHLLHAVVLHQDDRPEEAFPSDADVLQRLFEIGAAEGDLDAAELVTIREATLRGHSAPEVILDYAQDIDADLIVMGTHGRRGPARLFLGSVAAAVVRHAHCPVLTQRGKGGGASKLGWNHIVVPVDFSDSSHYAVRVARELAIASGASMQLLHVLEITAYPYFYVPARPEVLDTRSEKAAETLALLAQEVLGQAVSYETLVVPGRPATEIARVANEHPDSLLMIGTHGLSGLARALLGSTTAEVVRTVDRPVLTVKPYGKSLLEAESEPAAEALA